MRSTLSRVAVACAVALALGGCGGDDPSPTGAESASSEPTSRTSATSESTELPTTPEPTDDAPEPVVVHITITAGEVTPVAERVDATVGQEIELHVDSDAADEIHVHSQPEREFEVAAKTNQTFRFSIDLPGQVEVELHEIGETVLKLVVQP